MIPFSKSGSPEAKVDQIRPIVVESHLTKIIEKAIKNKLEDNGSQILATEEYQSGFKTEVST